MFGNVEGRVSNIAHAFIIIVLAIVGGLLAVNGY